VDYGLAGRVAVITGAAGAIGSALARAFAEQGTRLVLLDRNLAQLRERAAELPSTAGVLCLAADLTVDADVAALTVALRQSVGCVDILINNAGDEYPTELADAAPDFMARWDRLLGNNAGSMVRLTRALLPLMPEGSAVINQSSIWGHTAVAGFSAYVASKHAILGLTRSLAWELAPRRIRVNAVCPGWVRTPSALRSLAVLAAAAGRDEADMLREILARQAVPELLQPGDLAGTFLFLASAGGAAITGQSVVVSHGEVMS
jgi:NAD(P)-dependent dehydrogenase (short-subunit alcohol dehydrogenase family)